MGLSQAKRKVKISNDPNNTNWTKDTSSFGHKILTSQGWTPGDYLGARDAAHAELYSAASASHIRVILKDDNLGLGAKKGSGQGPGECTGLDAFTSLLGRLNADDQEEYVQEEKKREDLKRAIYTEQKWGSMRFVKGGFLVGDKVVEIAEKEAERVRNLENVASSKLHEASKRDDMPTEEDTNEELVTKKKDRKEKKSKKRADDGGTETVKEKSGKEKKRRKNKEEAESDATEETEAERKLRRKEKKEKKRKAEEGSSVLSSKKRKGEDDPVSSTKSKKRRKSESVADETQNPTETKSRKHKDKKSKSTSGDVTPETTEKAEPIPNVSRPTILQGRHAVRARYIAQKRMASMDATALNQIFMVKS